MKIVVESNAYTLHNLGVIEDFGVFGPIQADFTHMNGIPTLVSEQDCSARSETLIKKDAFQAT